MKGTKLFFAVWLALLGVGNVWANDADDIARAATRRGTTNTITTTTRKKVDTPNTKPNETNTISRSTNTKSNASQTMRNRAVEPRTGTVISNTSRTGVIPTAHHTSTRTATNVLNRQTTGTIKKTGTANLSRSATKPTSARTATLSKASSARSANRRPTMARAGTMDSVVETVDQNALRDKIMSADNKACRDVYYECMDEFCANKDTQLKRCACSSRLHEFDDIKKQLANSEEKMLEFNQRLLTVGMDAEDAAALNIATEGEIAFNQKDTSESQKLLDELSKKLNTKFEDTSLDQSLTAISLSLNEDTAFDNIDSLMGASTTLKTGTALYSAALPVCREMAAEVCSPEQLEIAESGYQMLIEQDCTTVKKTYQTQADLAREKVLEGSALLDMSRLSAYQERNSDDILTCKKKMLDMLTNSSICGENLSKCLDTTGKYINPATGNAFLTADLANLDNLIIRPSGSEKWTELPNNKQFVSFLDSKKTFLEPAMKNCQDISDYVWDEFVEDALAQIKLAQGKKLEEIRQSCTTLTTQCLTEANKTITDFDSRALSIFGVMADVTVNTMCADVKNACAALMTVPSGSDGDWNQGMTDISIEQTYNTIVQTCREVGRACIIQACKSISGNFGLCENIDTSVNRKSIINATSCWDDVYQCVANAGNNTIDKIISMLIKNGTLEDPAPKQTASDDKEEDEEPDNNTPTKQTPPYSFYAHLYSTIDTKPLEKSSTCINTSSANCVYDICVAQGLCSGTYDATEQTSADKDSIECKICRITESLWGNCEAIPSIELDEEEHNKILQPKDTTTLLYWFAVNTGTNAAHDSCRDTSCEPGYTLHNGTCRKNNEFIDDGICSDMSTQFQTKSNGEDLKASRNCCSTGTFDNLYDTKPVSDCANNNACYQKANNCCSDGTNTTITLPAKYGTKDDISPIGTEREITICIPKDYRSAKTAFMFQDNNKYYGNQQVLVCISKKSTAEISTTNNKITCSNGRFIIVDIENNIYKAPTSNNNKISNSFSISDIDSSTGIKKYTLNYRDNQWKWCATEQDCTSDFKAPSLDDDTTPTHPFHKVSFNTQ